MNNVEGDNGFSFPEYVLMACIDENDFKDSKDHMDSKDHKDSKDQNRKCDASMDQDVCIPSMQMNPDKNEVAFDHRNELREYDLHSLQITRLPNEYVLKTMEILLDHMPVASIEYPPLCMNLLPLMLCDGPYVFPTSKMYYQTLQFRFTYEDQYDTVTQVVKHPMYSHDTHNVYDNREQKIKEMKIVIGYRDIVNMCQKNTKCISPEMQLCFGKTYDENFWCEGPPLNVRVWQKTSVYKDDLRTNYLLTLLHMYDMRVEDYMNALGVLSDESAPDEYGVYVKNTLMFYGGKGMLTVNFER